MTHRRSVIAVTAGAVAVIAQSWLTFQAPWVAPGTCAVAGIVLLALFLVNVVLSKRRRIRVSHALRRDTPELIALQDDFLGRLPSQDSAPIDVGPVATQVEFHGDPQGDLVTGGDQRAGDHGGRPRPRGT